MLRRTPEMVELAIDDYVVAQDARGEILGVRRAQGVLAVGRRGRGDRGVARCARLRGRPAIVDAVEALARKRGIYDVFALTLQPEFFAAIGYQRVDRARYPEKIRRDCLGCARRFACNEICFAKNCSTRSQRSRRRRHTTELGVAAVDSRSMRRPERRSD